MLSNSVPPVASYAHPELAGIAEPKEIDHLFGLLCFLSVPEAKRVFRAGRPRP